MAQWTGWAKLSDNQIGSSPAIAAEPNGELWMVARGLDDRIYYNRRPDSLWRGWKEVGGATGARTQDSPAAVTTNGLLSIFIRGTDDRVYRGILNKNGQFGGWDKIDSNPATSYAPAAVEFRGEIYVFVTGKDSYIYVTTYNGSTWSGWKQVPGKTGSIYPPSVTEVGGYLDVALTSKAKLLGTAPGHPVHPKPSGRVDITTYEKDPWSGTWWRPHEPDSLPNVWDRPALASSNATASSPADVLNLFVVSANYSVQRYAYAGGVHTSEAVGGDQVTKYAPSVASVHPYQLWVAVRGLDDKVYVNSCDPTVPGPQSPGGGGTPAGGGGPQPGAYVGVELILEPGSSFDRLRVFGHGFDQGETLDVRVISSSSNSAGSGTTTPSTPPKADLPLGSFSTEVGVTRPAGATTTHTAKVRGLSSNKEGQATAS